VSYSARWHFALLPSDAPIAEVQSILSQLTSTQWNDLAKRAWSRPDIRILEKTAAKLRVRSASGESLTLADLRNEAIASQRDACFEDGCLGEAVIAAAFILFFICAYEIVHNHQACIP
jgi:hypothetical protein